MGKERGWEEKRQKVGNMRRGEVQVETDEVLGFISNASGQQKRERKYIL